MIPDRSGRCGGSPCGHPPYRDSFSPRRRDWAGGERTTCAATPSPWRWERCPLLIRSISRAPGTVTPGTTVPRGGRVVYLDAIPVASKHGRDPHERGPRPHHRMGCPQGPCSVAASGPAGSRWPERDHHPRKACSAPTGRRFPSCSCRSPHPRPTQAHFASRHRTPLPRLTLERPQPRGLPRVTAPAPGLFPSATSPPGPSGETVPSCEPAPDLLSLTKLACKRFHKGGAGRFGASATAVA